jgi:hypothetical protein
MLSPSIGIGAERCETGQEAGTFFGKWEVISPSKTHDLNELGSTTLGAPAGMRYTRVLVEVTESGDGVWVLSFRDADRRILQTMGPSDFGAGKLAISKRLPVGTVEIHLNHAGTSPKFELRQKANMPVSGALADDFPYYSLKVPNNADWKELYEIPDTSLRTLGDNVGMLMVGLQEGLSPISCSGVALPPDMFLTNWHCGPVFGVNRSKIVERFWEQPICDRTVVDLSWDDDQISREFICERLLAKSQELDYALLRIRSIEGMSAIGQVRMRTGRNASQVFMVHHPMSEKKKISENCPVELPANSGVSEIFFHHCDSETGSSGAPLFDSDRRLVGIHYSGFEKDPATGQCDKRNKAVWMDEVLADLEKQAGGSEELRQVVTKLRGLSQSP